MLRPFSNAPERLHITLPSRASENEIREKGILGQMLQWPRIRLIEAMKMMGRSARGWSWLVEKEKVSNRISRYDA